MVYSVRASEASAENSGDRLHTGFVPPVTGMVECTHAMVKDGELCTIGMYIEIAGGVTDIYYAMVMQQEDGWGIVPQLPTTGSTIMSNTMIRSTTSFRPGVGIGVAVWVVFLLLPLIASAQLMINEDFTGFSNGSLAGQGNWTNKNQTNLVINVDNSLALSRACYNGGGGPYATPVTGDIPYNQRLQYTTTPVAANTDQVFFVSFLVNISNAGSDVNAHILGLGNDFGGTSYEFLRVHVQSAGAGFALGISEGGGTGLAANSGGGIQWGSTVYNLNQTYLVVVRYDYDNGGGANSDAVRLWVNPAVGSQPSTGSAQAAILPGGGGNDVLFDGDNISNLYLNYRGVNSPVYAIDAIRYARGATSAAAWTNLNASGDSSPTVGTTATAVATNEDTPITLTVTVGDAQTALQNLTVTATSSNPALVPTSGVVVLNTTGATRSIVVTPGANLNGSAQITVTVGDECQNVAITTFTLTVNAVNDAPSFSTGSNILVGENSGAYSAAFATAINDGDPEVAQTLTFNVSNNNNALFSVQPTINSSGALSFTPAVNATGVAVVSVSLSDNGGTANGGVNTSAVQNFTIRVVAVTGFYDDFNNYSNGSLSGQGSWVTKNSNDLVINIANASPITYPSCQNGGGGRYATPVAGGIPYTQRLSRPTTNFVANTDQVFYVSFLLNISNGGTDENAHIVGLGNDFGGTDYEFLRIHTRTSGTGFNIGISEGGGSNLASNSGGGIEWGTTVYNLNQTYYIVARYDYDNGGGANADIARIWVNPADGSEPVPANAVAVIAGGARGNDILFDGDNVRNLYLNYRGAGSPEYRIDAIRYARGATSTLAWSSLNVGGSDTPPVVGTTATAVSTNEDTAVTLSVTVSDAQTATQYLVVTAASGNQTLVPASGIVVQNSTGTTRTITVTPAANLNGTAPITVIVTDVCGSTSAITFTLTVNPVNDAPSFSTGANVFADAGAPYSAAFATAINDGDAEVAQNLTFVVSNNNNALFSVQPSISATGVLSFTTVSGANGTAVVSVYLQDDGGTANGGINTSGVQTFTIRVAPINGFYEDFTGYSNGSLAGQGGWVNKNQSTLVFNVDNTSPITYPCYNGGGGPYVTPVAGGIPFNQRIARPTTNFVATTDQVFYLSFLLNVANGGTDEHAHIVGLGNDFGGTDYEFLRIHTRTSGTGFNVGISEGGGTGLGVNSGGGITWGTTVYNLNQTYLMIARYDYDNAGGSNNDQAWIWVNPSTGTQPNTASADATIAPGASGNDILFDGDNVRNLYLNYRGAGSPEFRIDAIHYVHDNTSAMAWTNLGAGTGDSAPVVSTTSTAVSTNEDTPVSLSVTVSDAQTALSSLVVTAQSSNQTLLPNGNLNVMASAGAARTIIATPASNQNGTVAITVTVQDECQNIGSTTFVLTVNPVNDVPTFSTGANVAVNEDNGAYNAAFATGISDGDPEVAQTLTFNVTNNNNALFSAQPAINTTTGFLSFTPAANANGVAVVSVNLSDNGGTANGGVNASATQTFTITVNSVNDTPTFSTGANVTVNEDSGAYNAAFATGISDGDPEVVQTLTFNVSNSNNALFSAQPTIDVTTGFLSFTPVANANGVAVVSVSLSDDGGTGNGGVDVSATQTFTITVNSVNDVPTFSTGANVTVDEDNGVYNAAFATGIDDGDPEVAQTLTFNVTNDNNALFSAQPAINATTGFLSFTPAANANGVAVVSVNLSDNGGTANGGVDVSATQTFTIAVSSINDAPTFSTGANVTVDEDNGAYNAAFATGISDGDPEVAQTLTFNVTNSNNALFSAQPTIDITTGFLSFTPVANANGVAVVSVSLSDDGGTANGGVDVGATQTFTITVNSVNDVPTFSTGANVTVNEDSGAYNAAFATGISDGDPEVAQTLTFNVSNSNNALFSVQPTIDIATGNLSFTPTANANGVAVVSVSLSDDGGTANGGVDASATQTFTITVNSVNDVPTFSTGANVVVSEDNGAYNAAFATGISDGDPEVAQTLTFNVTNNNNALFSVQPSIDVTTGFLSFTPAANANGVAVVSVSLSDNGGTANGGVDASATQTFTITVNSVNDAPTFSTGANVTVNEDSGAYNAAFATGISDGDPEVVQTLTFNVSNSNNALFSVQPTIDIATGNLSFTPAANANGVAVVSVNLSDNGGTANGGVDVSATQTFTMTVNSVNDAPTFTTGANVSVLDNSGPYNAAFTTGISDGDPEVAQTLTFNVSNTNNALFSVQPAINATTGFLSFTPIPGVSGIATVSVSLNDNGGTANGGVNTSGVKTFTITVVLSNRPPVAVNDAASTCTGTPVVISPLTNDGDPDGDALIISSVTQGSNGAVVILPGNTTVRYTPAAAFIGTDTFRYTVNDGKGATSTATVTVTVSGLTINVKVLLEGPYTSNGRMDTLLSQQGYIPLASPYAVGGTVAAIPNGTVDWILLEFRSNTSAASTVLRKAAFLKYDGTVMGATGAPLTLSAAELPTGNYYIVVRHRNHLAIMSSSRVATSGCGLAWNFTTAQSSAYSTLQDPMYRVQLSPAYYAMRAADPNGDGISTALDRVMITLDYFSYGYQDSDLTMNGYVNTSDLLISIKHLFQFTQVP